MKVQAGWGQTPAESSSKLHLSSRRGLATPLWPGLQNRGQPRIQPGHPARRHQCAGCSEPCLQDQSWPTDRALVPVSKVILSSRQTHPLTRTESGSEALTCFLPVCPLHCEQPAQLNSAVLLTTILLIRAIDTVLLPITLRVLLVHT